MAARFGFIAMIALCLCGCKDEPATEQPAASDTSAQTDTTTDANGAPDTADSDAESTVELLACACEANETCADCFKHIGECCYDDPGMFHQLDRFAGNCERAATCKGCCNECAKTPCDKLKAGHMCPNI